MGHYADDLAPLRLGRAHAKQDPLADRRLIGKRLRSKCRINYEQVAVRRAVVLCERSSREQRRAHRLEITGQNDLKIGSLKLARIVLRFGSAPTHRIESAGEWQWIRGCNTVHTWECTELLAKLALESISLLRCIADVAEQLKRQKPARVKAHIHTLNVN